MFKYIALIVFALSTPLNACAAPPKPAPTPRLKTPGAENKPAPAPTVQDQAQIFAAWKRGFMARAIAKGYDAALVKATIGPAKINPKAIQSNEQQPEFTRAIWTYVDGVVSTSRLDGGRAKLAKHADLFGDIEARYGVDRTVLTSIWGLESAYGKILGHDNMIDSLATLASQGRRQKFGEQQLFGLLDMLARGDVRRDQLVGSWAGAMGMTQFIPTTFRDYAVDYDNNGNKDLWTDVGDALASTAYYLSRFGWRGAEPIVTEVLLPEGFNYGLSDGTKRSISGWSAMGVRPVGGKNWSKEALFLEAKLLIPAGVNGPVFLTFKNFDVIKKYNNSTSYALGITVLAEALQGKKTITKDWPRQDKPLARSPKKALQEALTSQGYSTGGIDGMIGPNSRRAIRAWQRANGLAADGYVNQALLRRVLTGK